MANTTTDKNILSSEWIKIEMNLAAMPLFALSRQDVCRRQSTEYHIVTEKEGQKHTSSWIVTANAAYGYPGPFDRKVFKAIEYLVNQKGLPVSNPVSFSLHYLCGIMDIGRSGPNKRRISGALRRLVATTIDSRGVLYSKSAEAYISTTFHLYDRVVFRGRTLPNGETAETNYLFLSDWYLDNINHHHVRPINYTYQRSLRSDLAGRLYEVLGAKFFGALKHRRSHVLLGYRELCQLLPMTPQRYPARARQTLKAAHEELTATAYLERIAWEQSAHQDWHLRYYPGERAKAEFLRTTERRADTERVEDSLVTAPTLQDADQALCEVLISRGIALSIAQRMAARYPDRIRDKVDIFDWICNQHAGNIKNPGGYLRRMIEEDWQAPEGYRSVIEREEASRRSVIQSARMERRSREQQWASWQARRPEEKIRGELFIWESRFKSTHGRLPTATERSEKTHSLLATLTELEERHRKNILGGNSMRIESEQ